MHVFLHIITTYNSIYKNVCCYCYCYSFVTCILYIARFGAEKVRRVQPNAFYTWVYQIKFDF